MKKIIIVSVIMVAAAFISNSAFAWRGMGNGHGGMHYSANTGDQQAFYDNTTEIRAALAADRAELDAILTKDNPDSAKIKTLTADIVKQQDELRKQAVKYNVNGMGMDFDDNYCGHNGNGHHGHMMGMY